MPMSELTIATVGLGRVLVIGISRVSEYQISITQVSSRVSSTKTGLFELTKGIHWKTFFGVDLESKAAMRTPSINASKQAPTRDGTVPVFRTG